MGVRSSLPGCFTGPGRPREGVPAKSKSDGICTRIPLSASPCEQAVCAIQLRLLQHFSSAIAAPSKSPRRTSMPTAFGSARTNGLPLELCGPASHLSFLLCASVRHTDACHSQGAQGTDREPPKLAHVRQPMTEVINPAWGFLARSKRGTRPMPAWLFGGTRQRRIQFCASGWEETKEGAAVWWRSPDDRTWL
jgi:hypothetical protein